MHCDDVELLIIVLSEGKLSHEHQEALAQHVSNCHRCSRFQDDLKKIREYLRDLPQPVPSPELIDKTYQRCQEILKTQNSADMRTVVTPPPFSVPKLIWAAILVLVVLTLLIMFPTLTDLGQNPPLSFGAAAVITLLLQNAAMLLLSPILLNRYRKRRTDFHRLPLNGNAT